MSAEIQKIHKGEVTLNDVRDKIITIQNKNVLLDSDVAWLYGVETKDINRAVKNNPDKFPYGYIFPVSEIIAVKLEITTKSDRKRNCNTLLLTSGLAQRRQ